MERCVMKRKKGFTFEKHNEVGEKLQSMRDYLVTLVCEISQAYPNVTELSE